VFLTESIHGSIRMKCHTSILRAQYPQLDYFPDRDDNVFCLLCTKEDNKLHKLTVDVNASILYTLTLIYTGVHSN